MKNFGIDISKWQGNIDLNRAKKEGVTFAILKAGGSDCGRYKDKKFDDFFNQCRALNIPAGAYYFGADKTVNEAINSAKHFISILNGKQFDLPIYYDVEGVMLNLSKKLLTDIVEAFCKTVEGAGYKAGIYTSQSVFDNKVDDTKLVNFSHWVARWSKSEPKELKSKANIDIWQFGGSTNYIRSNKIAGVVCDQDYCYIDLTKNAGKPINYNPPKAVITSKSFGNQKCPYPIAGYVNFDLLDWSAVYDEKFYKEKYPDLTKNGLKTSEQFLNHFTTIGIAKEKRQGNADFNIDVYMKNNKDLVDIFGNDFKWYYAHYILAGKKEGRTANGD